MSKNKRKSNQEYRYLGKLKITKEFYDSIILETSEIIIDFNRSNFVNWEELKIV